MPNEENEYPTQEEYQNKIANNLWTIKEAKWVDNEGNVYPEIVDLVGFGDVYAYYFLENGVIYFPGHAYPFSKRFDYLYDCITGYLSPTPDKICTSCPQIIKLNDNELIIKDYVGVYRENLDSPYREDIWRLQKYVLDEDPNWNDLLNKFSPVNYNPEDYGMK